jgi:hypothetical protein
MEALPQHFYFPSFPDDIKNIDETPETRAKYIEDLAWLKTTIRHFLPKCDLKNYHSDEYIEKYLMYYCGKMLKPNSWNMYDINLAIPKSWDIMKDNVIDLSLNSFDNTDVVDVMSGIIDYVPDARLSLRDDEYGPMNEETYHIFDELWQDFLKMPSLYPSLLSKIVH